MSAPRPKNKTLKYLLEDVSKTQLTPNKFLNKYNTHNTETLIKDLKYILKILRKIEAAKLSALKNHNKSTSKQDSKYSLKYIQNTIKTIDNKIDLLYNQNANEFLNKNNKVNSCKIYSKIYNKVYKLFNTYGYVLPKIHSDEGSRNNI